MVELGLDVPSSTAAAKDFSLPLVQHALAPATHGQRAPSSRQVFEKGFSVLWLANTRIAFRWRLFQDAQIEPMPGEKQIGLFGKFDLLGDDWLLRHTLVEIPCGISNHCSSQESLRSSSRVGAHDATNLETFVAHLLSNVVMVEVGPDAIIFKRDDRLKVCF